jgi:hypothetical protein
LWYDIARVSTGREPMQMPSITSALGGSETLPSESKEKKLLDGFLAGRERVREEVGKSREGCGNKTPMGTDETGLHEGGAALTCPTCVNP